MGTVPNNSARKYWRIISGKKTRLGRGDYIWIFLSPDILAADIDIHTGSAFYIRHTKLEMEMFIKSHLAFQLLMFMNYWEVLFPYDIPKIFRTFVFIYFPTDRKTQKCPTLKGRKIYETFCDLCSSWILVLSNCAFTDGWHFIWQTLYLNQRHNEDKNNLPFFWGITDLPKS